MRNGMSIEGPWEVYLCWDNDDRLREKLYYQTD